MRERRRLTPEVLGKLCRIPFKERILEYMSDKELTAEYDRRKRALFDVVLEQERRTQGRVWG